MPQKDLALHYGEKAELPDCTITVDEPIAFKGANTVGKAWSKAKVTIKADTDVEFNVAWFQSVEAKYNRPHSGIVPKSASDSLPERFKIDAGETKTGYVYLVDSYDPDSLQYSDYYEAIQFSGSSLYKKTVTWSPDAAKREQDKADALSENFFSSSENQTAYTNALKVFDYAQLQAMLSEWAETNQPDKNNGASKALALIEEAAGLASECEVDIDAFDGAAALYYAGLNDISYDHHIVPYIKGNTFSSLNFLVGFYELDWLFFERVELKLDGNAGTFTNSWSSYKTTRDVVGDGICEKADWSSLYKDKVAQLTTTDAVAIRFTGDRGNNDYDLTPEEQRAIKVLARLSQINEELRELRDAGARQ